MTTMSTAGYGFGHRNLIEDLRINAILSSICTKILFEESSLLHIDITLGKSREFFHHSPEFQDIKRFYCSDRSALSPYRLDGKLWRL